MSLIPDITDERLAQLSEEIVPLLRKDGELHYIKVNDERLRDQAYLWDPQIDGRVSVDLMEVCDITTFHTWGHYSMFKPSIAEVLAQIPERLADCVMAFEMVEEPKTADDLNRHWLVTQAGYHVARVRLYAAKSEQEELYEKLKRF